MKTRFNQTISVGDIILFPRNGVGGSAPDIIVGVVHDILPQKTRRDKNICLETYEWFGGKEYTRKVRIANAIGCCVINNLIARELNLQNKYIYRSLEIKGNKREMEFPDVES